MRCKLISTLVAGLLAGIPLAVNAADDTFALTGNLGIGARGVNVNALDPSKFREYRDLGGGAIGIFDIRGQSGRAHV